MIKLFGGFLIGVSVALSTTMLPAVAPWYSQTIYDCGIRVAAGVTGASVTDVTITDYHKYGVCID